MQFTYPAVVFKNDHGYNFVFPDLEYLGITGSTLEYARNFAKEDLKAYIIQQVSEHQGIPVPTPLKDIDIQELENKLALDFKVLESSKENVTVDIPEIEAKN